MKLRLIKPWNLLSPGSELDVNPPVAEILIGRGIAGTLEPRPKPKVTIVGRRSLRKEANAEHIVKEPA